MEFSYKLDDNGKRSKRLKHDVFCARHHIKKYAVKDLAIYLQTDITPASTDNLTSTFPPLTSSKLWLYPRTKQCAMADQRFMMAILKAVICDVANQSEAVAQTGVNKV
jgi:hypothetical protein